jgi:GNAT superfamily N-acetyltransferase
METDQLLALHDRKQRIEVEETNMRREATAEVVRLVNLLGSEGTVVYSRLDADSADRVIDEQIAFFEALGQDFEWKLYGHDTPADLRERLLARGFAPEEPESLLILDLQEAPARLLAPVTHDIRRVVEPRQLEELGRIQERVWGEPEPEYIAALRDDLERAPDSQSIYLAYADGVPVSYGRITFQADSPFSGLWGGSTLAEHRGKGFYTALLAVRLQEALRRGVRFLTIDASPMSRPIVEKQGFRFLTWTQPFKWHHSEGSA